MDKQIRYKNKMYEIRIDGREFAQVLRLEPRELFGPLANWIAEITGKDPITYDIIRCKEEETIMMALEFGPNFSRSYAWRNLFMWAQLMVEQNRAPADTDQKCER